MDNGAVEIEGNAMRLKREGNPEAAAHMLEVLLNSHPDWEHGHGHYALAECYESIGSIEKAGFAFNRALQFDPESNLFLSGYASFLYIRGDSRMAIDLHLRLYAIYLNQNNFDGAARTLRAIEHLGKRLNLNANVIRTILDAQQIWTTSPRFVTWRRCSEEVILTR